MTDAAWLRSASNRLGASGPVASAANSGTSFASAYALGQVARRYYAAGRTFSTDMLRETFRQMLGEAKGLQANYLPQMQAQARSLNPAKIVEMVRGS